MSDPFEALRKMKDAGDFAKLAELIPYSRFMGITIDQSTGELLGKMSFDDKLIGSTSLGALHGGTLGALLESTAIFQILWELEVESLPKIVTITVDYLRSAKSVDTYARGVITKHGRRVVNVAVTAWQTNRDKPVATANVHFLLRSGVGDEKRADTPER